MNSHGVRCLPVPPCKGGLVRALKLSEAALLVSWVEAEAVRMGVKDPRKAAKAIDSNATAAGMSRLLDGKNVKDTVKK
jgi:hypothetical protein